MPKLLSYFPYVQGAMHYKKLHPCGALGFIKVHYTTVSTGCYQGEISCEAHVAINLLRDDVALYQDYKSVLNMSVLS